MRPTLYRSTPSARLLALPPLALAVGLSLLAALVSLKVLDYVPQAAIEPKFPLLAPVLYLCFALFNAAIAIPSLAVALSRLLASLEISPEGITYGRLPFRPVISKWQQAERIHTINKLGRSVSTLLVRRELPGLEVQIGHYRLGSRTYQTVPLSDFEGWADGSIPRQIREFAPRLLPDSEIPGSHQAA